MQTSQLVDIIKEYGDSQLTRSRALVYLNNAQNELLIGENRLMRVLPDPFLTTVAGTFQYTASTDLYGSVGNVKGTDTFDVYNVSEIYSFNKDNALLFRYNGAGNSTSSRMYTSLSEVSSDKVIAPADTTKSIEPNSDDCLIDWWGENDPGATTVDWRCECYRYPNQLTAEGIALETPAKYQDTLLLWLVLKRLGIRQFGTSNIDNLIIPKMREFKIDIAKGAQSRSRFTPIKEV